MEQGSQKLAETPGEKVQHQVFKWDAGFDNWMLKVSGSQADCPFQSVAVFWDGNTNNSPMIIKQPCTTKCPMARLWKGVEGDLHYTVSCGAVEKTLDVTEETNLIQKASGFLKPLI